MEKEKLKKYLDSRHSAEEMTLDPLDYWIQKNDLYLLLFPLASSILCTQHAEMLQGEREIKSLI